MKILNLIPGMAQIKAGLKFLPYIALAALAIFAVFQWQSAKHWHKQFNSSEEAHDATKASYKKAQIAARAMNAAQVAERERLYAIETEKAESGYEKRLADNRAGLAKWMRGQASVKGNTGGADTSGSSSVPSETVSGTSQAVVSYSDLEIAADNYSQLTALIEWAQSVGKVK